MFLTSPGKLLRKERAMAITQDALKKQIAAGKFAPLYCFYGQNIQRIEETVSSLQAALCPSGCSEFDCNSFDAELHTPAEILNAAQTLPLQAAMRLVVVKRADTFKAAQWEVFHRYLGKPAKRTCLVFIINAEKLGFSGKLQALFDTAGVMVSFEARKKDALDQAIREYLARYGKKISPDALQLIIDTLGAESAMLYQELEKLALYCGDRADIRRDDAAAVLSGAEQHNVFQLVEAIGMGDTRASLQRLTALMESGMEPLPILGMISRQFRLLAVVRDGLEQGGKTAEIMTMLKEFDKKVSRGRGNFYPPAVERLMRQARTWSRRKISRAFEKLAFTDALLKSSRIDKKLILEHLILQLA
jgi:DNA polymerase-3 subunit delta